MNKRGSEAKENLKFKPVSPCMPYKQIHTPYTFLSHYTGYDISEDSTVRTTRPTQNKARL